MRGNTIFKNANLGINLVGGPEVARKPRDGVTPNDVDDSDTGPNGLMNFPLGVTAWYDGSDTYISGTVHVSDPRMSLLICTSAMKWTLRVSAKDATTLGSVTPKESGAFHFKHNGTLPVGHPFLSATATDVSGKGSTSEFSPVYGDPNRNGHVDDDEDGLPDEWETKGIDFDGDGRIDLDLNALGARPDHKDVFIEIDYIEGAEFRDASIDMVKAAFAAAPVHPDGTFGIVLHANTFAEADRIPRQTTWFEVYMPTANDDFGDLKDRWFGTASDRCSQAEQTQSGGARSLVFRYAVFAHEVSDYPDAGGLSDLWGDDFVVATEGSDYDVQGGRDQVEAGTFMHELGHALGLMHGGPMPPGPHTAVQMVRGTTTSNPIT